MRREERAREREQKHCAFEHNLQRPYMDLIKQKENKKKQRMKISELRHVVNRDLTGEKKLKQSKNRFFNHLTFLMKKSAPF